MQRTCSTQGRQSKLRLKLKGKSASKTWDLLQTRITSTTSTRRRAGTKTFMVCHPPFIFGIVINLLEACETTTLWSSASQMTSTTRMRHEGWLKLLSEILAAYLKNSKKYLTPSFFCGQFVTVVKILEFFVAQHHVDTPFVRTPVLELIKSNTEDDIARHLMIISNGDAAVEALEKHLYS